MREIIIFLILPPIQLFDITVSFSVTCLVQFRILDTEGLQLIIYTISMHISYQPSIGVTQI